MVLCPFGSVMVSTAGGTGGVRQRGQRGGPNISKGICIVSPVIVGHVPVVVSPQFENGKTLPIGTLNIPFPWATSATRVAEKPPNVAGHCPLPADKAFAGTEMPCKNMVKTWPGAAAMSGS